MGVSSSCTKIRRRGKTKGVSSVFYNSIHTSSKYWNSDFQEVFKDSLWKVNLLQESQISEGNHFCVTGTLSAWESRCLNWPDKSLFPQALVVFGTFVLFRVFCCFLLLTLNSDQEDTVCFCSVRKYKKFPIYIWLLKSTGHGTLHLDFKHLQSFVWHFTSSGKCTACFMDSVNFSLFHSTFVCHRLLANRLP